MSISLLLLAIWWFFELVLKPLRVVCSEFQSGFVRSEMEWLTFSLSLMPLAVAPSLLLSPYTVEHKHSPNPH